MIEDAVAAWHAAITHRSPDALDALLAEDVVFYSPIVYTPQRGKEITKVYLEAAMQVLAGTEGQFRYTKQVQSDDVAILEFETSVDGKYVNGVDIIRCDSAARIVEFRVMLRPLQAVHVVHERMRALLDAGNGD